MRHPQLCELSLPQFLEWAKLAATTGIGGCRLEPLGNLSKAGRQTNERYDNYASEA